MLEILDIGVAMPERRQSMQAASDDLCLSPKDRRMYERFFGLEQFPRDPDQSLQAMTDDACTQLARTSGFTNDDLDMVIHCHTLLSVGPIHSATVPPMRRYGTDRSEAFSMTMNHCATAVSLLQALDTLLPATGTALVIISDKGFHPVLRVIKNTTIMGESAVAMLVGRRPGKYSFVAGHTERLCRYALMTGLLDEQDEPGFAKEYVGFVVTCILGALSRSNLKIDQISLILPHNVNLPSWAQIIEAVHARVDQVYLRNVARYGHMFNADPYINLVDAAGQGLLRAGDFVLLVSVGLGATASCAVLQVNGPKAVDLTSETHSRHLQKEPLDV